MYKYRIQYRTEVAISAEYRKDIGYLAQKICPFEFYMHKPGFVIKHPISLLNNI